MIRVKFDGFLISCHGKYSTGKDSIGLEYYPKSESLPAGIEKFVEHLDATIFQELLAEAKERPHEKTFAERVNYNPKKWSNHALVDAILRDIIKAANALLHLSKSGRVMKSRYDGRCDISGRDISEGDEIVYVSVRQPGRSFAQPHKFVALKSEFDLAQEISNLSNEDAQKPAKLSKPAHEIVEAYETFKRSEWKPAWSAVMGVDAHRLSLEEKEVANVHLKEITKISNELYQEYDVAKVVVRLHDEGKKVPSKYAGTSAISGNPFAAGTEIFYLRRDGYGAITAPVEEVEELY